jgi:hypothetical protein
MDIKGKLPKVAQEFSSVRFLNLNTLPDQEHYKAAEYLRVPKYPVSAG